MAQGFLAENGPASALHIPTPLLYSTVMSKQAGCNVWLKLENLQPTQSFKIRGIGRLCTKAVLENGTTHLVIVGDTNAALNVAYTGRQLGVDVSVFVPIASLPSIIRPKIEVEGGVIVERGHRLRETYQIASEFVSTTPGAMLIDTSDNDNIVDGIATMIPEISVQLHNRVPAVVICVVGSGGLLSGILTGLQQCHWQSVPVVAVETHNTNTFQRALLAGSQPLVDGGSVGPQASDNNKPIDNAYPQPNLLLPLDNDCDLEDGCHLKESSATIIEDCNLHRNGQSYGHSGNNKQNEPTAATCLLTNAICSRALNLSRMHPVVPISVSEAMASEACRHLLDDHQFLVEVGSAAALSVVGKGLIHKIIPGLDTNNNIVIVVSGGANTNYDQLESYRQRFPYPAPIIAKSGQEIFMKMTDTTSPCNGSNTATLTSANVASTAGLSYDAISTTTRTIQGDKCLS